jgi:hypothetical protein
MGNGSVHDQRIQEARDSDSQASHGNGRNADDEESGPMQDSVSNGSASDIFVQIEMSNTEVSQGVGRAL